MAIHLRIASADAPNAAYQAELDKLAAKLRADSCSVVCIYDTRAGDRKFLALGEVDADAVAGYSARCLASLANEA